MKNCVVCNRVLDSPLDEYGSPSEPVCRDHWLKPDPLYAGADLESLIRSYRDDMNRLNFQIEEAELNIRRYKYTDPEEAAWWNTQWDSLFDDARCVSAELVRLESELAHRKEKERLALDDWIAAASKGGA